MLTARNLGKRYGGTWALRGCTFDLPPGSVTALVGPNGAGKTTLISLATGFLRPTEGEVSTGSGTRVSYVAQDKPLYATFTPSDMFAFGRRMNLRWNGTAAHAWLDRFDVPANRRCGSLSGGERAHVALALALGTEPDVLLLDEPLANLDPLVRTDTVRGIVELARSGETTVLLSTHVVAELHGIADRLLLLDHGRLVVDGAVADLLAAHTVYESAATAPVPDGWDVVHADRTGDRATLLLRGAPPPAPRWSSRGVDLDELILGYLRAAREHPRTVAS